MSYKYEAISKEDTYELIERAKNGDSAAFEELVERNTGLVRNIALRFACGSYETEDLMQIGYIGLIKAARRFDKSFDVMFSTYAVPMIMGEIKRYLRDDGRIKVSRQLKMDMYRLRGCEEEFSRNCGRSPRVSELAEQLGLNAERVCEVMEARDAFFNLESLDDPERIEDGGSGILGGSEGYLSEENSAVDMIYLKTVIRKLEDKERQIIVLRYFKDMTQQQIAVRLGMSQVQVSRIEKRVLKRLKMEMNVN